MNIESRIYNSQHITARINDIKSKATSVAKDIEAIKVYWDARKPDNALSNTPLNKKLLDEYSPSETVAGLQSVILPLDLAAVDSFHIGDIVAALRENKLIDNGTTDKLLAGIDKLKKSPDYFRDRKYNFYDFCNKVVDQSDTNDETKGIISGMIDKLSYIDKFKKANFEIFDKAFDEASNKAKEV